MRFKQAEVTATPTLEKGTAVLLVAAYTRDRGGDVIQRGAFSKTISAWIGSGKQIPLAWDHETGKPENVIGTVDPKTLRETRDGLLAEARLDLEGSATAREAWRSIKNDSVGVSFGYLSEEESDEDGYRLLKSIDLYEISLTPTPMNADTRVVSWKSSKPEPVDDDQAFLANLRQREVEHRQATEIAALAGTKTTKPHGPVTVARFDC